MSANTAAQLRLSRLRAQRLTLANAARSPVEAVRHLIGVQAQIPSAASFAVRVRTADARAVDVNRGIAPCGPLVRTWLMRGTLHLATAEDVDWLLAVLAPAVLRGSRRRHAELGLSAATLARSADLLVRLLAGGRATRSELFAGLAEQGLDPAGQRGIHMIRHAALHGLLSCGPDQDREQTWVLREPSPPIPDREEALADLANRYRRGYGPADVHDLAAWSGLPVSDARQAWRLAGDGYDEPGHGGIRRPTVRLLPHFDPYLLGYAGRDHAVPAEHARKIWTGGGYVLPTVTVDGWAVGTWRSENRGGRIAVTVTPFDPRPLVEAVSARIDAEVADIGRFLDRDVSWSVGTAREGGEQVSRAIRPASEQHPAPVKSSEPPNGRRR
jgi:DNA glycosylase AlkZ-like